MRKLALSAAILLVASCSAGTDPAATTTTTAAIPTTIPGADPVPFSEFATAAMDLFLDRDPEWRTHLGLAPAGSAAARTLTDVSPRFREETATLAVDILDDVDGYLDGAATDAEHISAGVLRWYLADLAAGAPFTLHDYGMNFITGVHADLPGFLNDVHPITSATDADDYIARLRAVPAKFDQLLDLLDAQDDAGIHPPRRVIDIARWQAQNVITVRPADNTLATTFAARMEEAGIDAATAETLLADAITALTESVYPAYEEFIDRLERFPVAADDGAWHLPDGDAYYAWALSHYVGAAVDPAEVHEIGLARVEEAKADISVALAHGGIDVNQFGFAGALAEARDLAGAYRFESDADRDEFLAATEASVTAALEAVAPWFSRLPATGIEVTRPPAYNEGSGTAYYRSPALDGSRPGIYYLDLGAPDFGLFSFRTTTYHEAIPGHHFQLALQAEATGLPLHQRILNTSGYAEGWALYAERLAWEAGLYEDDPIGDLGRLSMELLRALRVVTDTGIHWGRWTRAEAIDYLIENGIAADRAESEVDRYIVWPGQAPAYTMGQLIILELREDARSALDDDFDIAAFHDVVLGSGALPLGVLTFAVRAWIAAG
jgi:uncharacterized protein (DUF885 family)